MFLFRTPIFASQDNHGFQSAKQGGYGSNRPSPYQLPRRDNSRGDPRQIGNQGGYGSSQSLSHQSALRDNSRGNQGAYGWIQYPPYHQQQQNPHQTQVLFPQQPQCQQPFCQQHDSVPPQTPYHQTQLSQPLQVSQSVTNTNQQWRYSNSQYGQSEAEQTSHPLPNIMATNSAATAKSDPPALFLPDEQQPTFASAGYLSGISPIQMQPPGTAGHFASNVIIPIHRTSHENHDRAGHEIHQLQWTQQAPSFIPQQQTTHQQQTGFQEASRSIPFELRDHTFMSQNPTRTKEQKSTHQIGTNLSAKFSAQHDLNAGRPFGISANQERGSSAASGGASSGSMRSNLPSVFDEIHNEGQMRTYYNAKSGRRLSSERIEAGLDHIDPPDNPQITANVDDSPPPELWQLISDIIKIGGLENIVEVSVHNGIQRFKVNNVEVLSIIWTITGRCLSVYTVQNIINELEIHHITTVSDKHLARGLQWQTFNTANLDVMTYITSIDINAILLRKIEDIKLLQTPDCNLKSKDEELRRLIMLIMYFIKNQDRFSHIVSSGPSSQYHLEFFVMDIGRLAVGWGCFVGSRKSVSATYNAINKLAPVSCKKQQTRSLNLRGAHVNAMYIQPTSDQDIESSISTQLELLCIGCKTVKLATPKVNHGSTASSGLA